MLGSAAEVDLFDITLSDTEVDGGDSETGSLTPLTIFLESLG